MSFCRTEIFFLNSAFVVFLVCLLSLVLFMTATCLAGIEGARPGTGNDSPSRREAA